MRIGLVLGGGGVVGMAYHAAVLSGIEDVTGWDGRQADVVVGTSAGALSGAELRAGFAPADLVARRSGGRLGPSITARLGRNGPPPVVRRQEVPVDFDEARRAYRELAAQAAVLPGSVRPGVMLSVAMSPGRLSAQWLSDTVRWMHGGDAGPDAALWLCAVRLDTGRRIVFGREGAPAAPIGLAVASSCAIPGVFAPVRVDGVPYIDGGAWSPTNLDVLASEELDLVVVSAPMSAEAGAVRDPRDRATRNGCREVLDAEVALLRRRGTRVVVFQPTATDLSAMGRLLGPDVLDDARCADVITRSRAAVVERLRRSGELDDLAGLGAPPLSHVA